MWKIIIHCKQIHSSIIQTELLNDKFLAEGERFLLPVIPRCFFFIADHAVKREIFLSCFLSYLTSCFLTVFVHRTIIVVLVRQDGSPQVNMSSIQLPESDKKKRL